MLEPDDPIIQATVDCIETELRSDDGGVHRYPCDTYYGGGEWILLAAWLGWYYVEVEQWEKAKTIKTWIEAQADDTGNLPEQVPVSLIDPEQLDLWCEKRGEIAKPLLWSHAKYLILCESLQTRLVNTK